MATAILLAANPGVSAGASFLLTVAGGYIDAQLQGFLFPPEKSRGPRIGELAIGGQDEGTPQNRAYGQNIRVPGTHIDFFAKDETITEEVGSKGRGQEVERQEIRADLVIQWSEGEFDSVRKIFGGTELVYDAAPDVNISSALLSCTIENEYHSLRLPGNPSVTETLIERRLVVSSPIAGPDLSNLLSGNDVVVAGWTEGDYNGTFRCISTLKNADNSSVAKFIIGLAASEAGEAAGNTITLDQTNPNFDTSKIEAITHHLGSENQAADAFLEAKIGTENTAYRGQCYTVMQGFVITNGVVQQFTAVLRKGATDDLEDVTGDVLTGTDIPAADWDVTALAGVECEGYFTRGIQTGLSQLQPLMLFADIVPTDQSGVTTFTERKNIPSVTVDSEDFVVTRSGPYPFEIDDTSEFEPPAEVLVKYQDNENQYQVGEQRERNPLARSTANTDEIDFQIAMDGGRGRDICAKQVWLSQSTRRGLNFQLPPSYLEIQENDKLTWTYESQPYGQIVETLTLGANGAIELRTRKELAANFTNNSPHELPETPAAQISSPYDVNLAILDIPPIQGSLVNAIGLLVCAVSRQPDVAWRGASLYQSTDSGTTWRKVQDITAQSNIGYTNSALPVISGSARWDRGTTLEVTLEPGASLSSTTELECLNGANRAVVGEEILGYVTATLAAVQPVYGVKYALSGGLLRGLLGTEQEADVHTAGDRFVQLNTAPLKFHSMSQSAIDTTRDFVAVAPGGDPDDPTAKEVTFFASGVKPLPPVTIGHGTRHKPSTNDWTVDFLRRSRSMFRMFSQRAPLIDNIGFIAEILDGSDNIVRTITSTPTGLGTQVLVDDRQVVYDQGDQITDFGSVQTTVNIRIFQLSDMAVRGRPTPITVLSE